MSKNKNKYRQQPSSRPPTPDQTPKQFPLGYDPSAKLVPVDVVSSKEAWSEFTLSDGSVIRTKSALLEVKRAEGQYSPDGNPIYVLQFAGLNQVNAPDSLRKKS
jgi:hypothetical protein